MTYRSISSELKSWSRNPPKRGRAAKKTRVARKHRGGRRPGQRPTCSKCGKIGHDSRRHRKGKK